MRETTIWGIHAGKTGDADELFLKHNCIAVGWAKMGDLSVLAPDREAFKAKVAICFPEKKPGAIPNNAGQLFRFVHELKEGDLVAYPSKQDREIHLGRVIGAYRYEPRTNPGYPNTRAVQWIKAVPRTRFSQGALYEIGSALSFFQVKNYADEFLTAIEGKVVASAVQQDETVGNVAEDVEETTRDYILKTLAQQLKGHALSHFVGHLLQRMGYHTRISPKGPDGGVDIIAHKDELGFEPPLVKVQVKSTEGSIGNPQVAELTGNVSEKEFGLFVALGSFTAQAMNFAKGKPNLRLIDGEELVRLVLSHYDQFDSAYKSILPLRRVYIPDVVADDED
jgi:restriction system protein